MDNVIGELVKVKKRKSHQNQLNKAVFGVIDPNNEADENGEAVCYQNRVKHSETYDL